MPENEFEKLLFETEDRRFGALSSSDIDTLAPMLADDLTYVHANGLAEDKGEFLRKIVSGERRYLRFVARSEEHTSELQSLMRISYAVFCLKKKTIHTSEIASQHLYHIHNKSIIFFDAYATDKTQ